jgi:hypothetical protein
MPPGEFIRDVFVRDLEAGTTNCATLAATGSVADGYTSSRALSGDARFLSVVSTATNLVVPPDDAAEDIFVRDLPGNRTVRVPADDDANRRIGDAALSEDGRHLVFVKCSGPQAEIVVAEIEWDKADPDAGH